MASIGILALLASAAVIAFSSNDGMTYSAFTTATGYPMTVVLPIIAILSVTSQWSQRSGLTTFTLVPHRGRIIAAKAVACVGVAIATIPLASAIGALGNVMGTTIAGIEPVWDLTVANMATIVWANVLGLLVGFTLGVLIRSSAGPSSPTSSTPSFFRCCRCSSPARKPGSAARSPGSTSSTPKAPLPFVVNRGLGALGCVPTLVAVKRGRAKDVVPGRPSGGSPPQTSPYSVGCARGDGG